MKFVPSVQSHCRSLLKQWILSRHFNYLRHRSINTRAICTILNGNKSSSRHHYRALTTSSPNNSEEEIGFRELGIQRAIARAAEKAFITVTSPTAAQKRFIPEILSGKDVLIHDRMGSGK